MRAGTGLVPAARKRGGVADEVGVVGMGMIVDVVVRKSALRLPPQSVPRTQSEMHIDE